MSRSLPPLPALRAFDAAARLGNFSRAAQEIHVTPSAISHQIKSLETFLGQPMFVRNGRRQVILTAEGKFFAERVAAALLSVGQAADQLRHAQRNRLTVSVLPSFAARWLMPRIGRFVDRHAGLELTVRSSTKHTDFLREEVDLAVRFGGGRWPGLQSELFMRDRLFPVVSPKLLRGKKPRRAIDLNDWPWLESDPEGWERWFAAANTPLPKNKRRLDFGDASLTLQVAIDGGGIAMSRASIAGAEVARGSVVRLVPSIEAVSQYSYYFVWPAQATLSQQAQAFRGWLVDEIKAERQKSKPAR
jgi:LysR family transcriptional regulator, glycine cleavage system transcriptional activator